MEHKEIKQFGVHNKDKCMYIPTRQTVPFLLPLLQYRDRGEKATSSRLVSISRDLRAPTAAPAPCSGAGGGGNSANRHLVPLV